METLNYLYKIRKAVLIMKEITLGDLVPLCAAKAIYEGDLNYFIMNESTPLFKCYTESLRGDRLLAIAEVVALDPKLIINAAYTCVDRVYHKYIRSIRSSWYRPAQEYLLKTIYWWLGEQIDLYKLGSVADADDAVWIAHEKTDNLPHPLACIFPDEWVEAAVYALFASCAEYAADLENTDFWASASVLLSAMAIWVDNTEKAGEESIISFANKELADVVRDIITYEVFEEAIRNKLTK